MKHIARLSLSLLIYINGLGGCCFAQSKAPSNSGSRKTEADPKGWKVFTSAEGGFSILLPGTPEEVVRELTYPFGKAQGHFFNLSTFATFGFSYTKLPIDVEASGMAKGFLDQARDGFVASSKGKPLDETEIELEGHPGRLLKMELPGGDIFRQKVIVVGSHVYQMVFISRDKGVPPAVLNYHESAAKRYFDSFKLL
jgi:hypothetical protein